MSQLSSAIACERRRRRECPPDRWSGRERQDLHLSAADRRRAFGEPGGWSARHSFGAGAGGPADGAGAADHGEAAGAGALRGTELPAAGAAHLAGIGTARTGDALTAGSADGAAASDRAAL